jgi:hypothetical protein
MVLLVQYKQDSGYDHLSQIRWSIKKVVFLFLFRGKVEFFFQHLLREFWLNFKCFSSLLIYIYISLLIKRQCDCPYVGTSRSFCRKAPRKYGNQPAVHVCLGQSARTGSLQFTPRVSSLSSVAPSPIQISSTPNPNPSRAPANPPHRAPRLLDRRRHRASPPPRRSRTSAIEVEKGCLGAVLIQDAVCRGPHLLLSARDYEGEREVECLRSPHSAAVCERLKVQIGSAMCALLLLLRLLALFASL